jgi:hypothetical protein
MKTITAAPVKITKQKDQNTKLKTQPPKSPFPRLEDPKQAKSLTTLFTPLYDAFYGAPKLSGYLAAAIVTFFSDQKIFVNQQADRISKNNKEPEAAYLEMANKFGVKALGSTGFQSKIRVTDNNVVLYTHPIELDFNITIPGPQDTAQRADLIAYMRTLFPNFVVPRVWAFNADGEPPILLDLGQNKVTTGWKPLDAFESIKFDNDTNNSYVPQEINFEDTASIEKQAFSTLYGIVTLESIGSYDKYSLGIEGKEATQGSIGNPIASASARVTVQTQMRVPMEMALWMLHATKPQDFNPKAFWEFSNGHILYSNGVSSIKPAKRTMTMDLVHSLNTKRQQEFGFQVKPRINEDGYMIAENGDILHIPVVNNISRFVSLQKTSYDPATGDLVPNHRIPEQKNLPVYSDWTNDVYAFTGDAGQLRIQPLGGGIPLDNITIAKYLRREPTDLFGITNPSRIDYESRASDKGSRIFQTLDVLLSDAKSMNLIEIPKGYEWTTLTDMWGRICQIDQTIGAIFSHGYENAEKDAELVDTFSHILRSIEGVLPKITRFGVETMMDLRFWITLLTKYAPNPKKYLQDYIDNSNRTTNVVVNELPTSVQLPNLAPGVFVLPHQLAAVEQFKRKPKLLILDFSAGGGKTGTSIFDILTLKMEGAIKTALILCPRVLVKEWCSEINKFSKGKLNAVPLTQQTLRKMKRKMGVDREQFLDYARKLPPNTIFVAGFSFLTLKSDVFADDRSRRMNVQYGNDTVVQYPSVWLIRQINPDYVCIDECFPGDAFVMVDYDKAISMKEVYENPSITHVLSYDLTNKKIVKKKILKKIRTKADENTKWISTGFKEGGKKASLICTNNHQIFMKDGSEKRADKIKIGEKVISYNGEFESYQTCKFCDKWFPAFGHDYAYHIAKEHPEHSALASTCDVCGKSMLSRNLNHHKQLLHVSGPTEYKKRISKNSTKGLRKFYSTQKGVENRSKKRIQMLNNNPMLDMNTRKRSGKGVSNAFWSKPEEEQIKQVKIFMDAPKHRSLPNNVEKAIINQNISDLEFTGNSKYFITLELDGKKKKKNPDFIYVPKKCGTCEFFKSEGCEKTHRRTTSQACEVYERSKTYRTNKVVEVMDLNYWHSPEEAKQVKKAYKKVGIKCLVIPATSIKKSIDQVRGRIESFINNHHPQKTSMRSVKLEEKYKYDLTVEGNHNYFVVATSKLGSPRTQIPILVHNSQHAKNLSSNTTKAIKQIAAYSDFRRIASGTLIKNRGDDLIGEASILNPAIYGNKTAFYDKYAITGGRSGSKFEGFKPGAETLIRKHAQEYTCWLTKRRADWSFLLPKINTRFWEVELTENQQRFYADLLNEAIDEIKKDKNLQKLFAEGDPSLEGIIEEKMKLYLAKIEIFINAPDDTKLPFANLSYIEQKDLVSPKVKFCQNLIKYHFEGGTLEGQAFPKQDGKIIIFGYNKATVEHFQRHFKTPYKGVFYFAGDEEAILKFRNDPEVKWLCAMEGTLREGLNLQCFPGNTPVLTDKKSAINIEDLYNDHNIKYVLSYDLDNKRIEKKKILNRIRTKVVPDDNFVLVSTRDDNTNVCSSFICTEDHHIFLKGGAEVPAKSLKNGDKLITFGGDYNVKELIDGQYLGGEERIKYLKSKSAKKQWEKSEFRELVSKTSKKTVKTKKFLTALKAANERRWSEEGRQEQSDRMKERWTNSDYRSHMKQCQKEWLSSPEYEEFIENFFRSPKARKRLSKTGKLAWENDDGSRKNACSKSSTDRWNNTKYKQKTSEAIRKALSSPEVIKKLSQASKKKWRNPEYREKTVASFIKAQNRPGVKAAASKRSIQNWKNLEFRAKTLKSIKESFNSIQTKKVRSKNKIDFWNNISDFEYNIICDKISEYHNRSDVLDYKSLYMQECWLDNTWRDHVVKKLKKNGRNLAFKEMMSEIVVETHEDDPTVLKRKIEALARGGILPNKTETRVINMGIDNLAYKGDGKYWTTLNFDGKMIHKNPDFIFKKPGSKRANKVVEVIGAREYTGRDRVYDKKLIKAYKKAGIDCLIVDAEDVWKNPKLVESRIQAHVNNHYLTVTKKIKLSKDDPRIGKYKYDLTVEGNHNYFISSFGSNQQKKVPVLVHNCASAVVRLQTLWSPGDQEQAVSRVMRPDVMNTYNRKEINYHWLVTNQTAEVAKTCRLVSKVVSNLTITEGANPEFAAFAKTIDMDKLPLITMSIETIQGLNQFQQLPEYIGAWEGYLAYEDKQFASRREDLRRLIAKKLGISLDQVTDEIIKKNSFTPVVSDTVIPGSRSAWVPLQNGTIPHDPFGLDLKSVAVLSTSKDSDEEGEDSDDDNGDEEEIEDVINLSPGDLVYTEFGLGYVRTILKKQVRVDIPGVPFSPVVLNKTVVFRPQDKQAETRVLKQLKANGKTGITFLNGFDNIVSSNSNTKVMVKKQSPSIILKSPVPKSTPTPLHDDDEDDLSIQNNKDRLPKRTNAKYSIEIAGGVFNGYPTIYMVTDQEHLGKVLKVAPPPKGYNQYPAFVYRHVRTWQGLKNLIAALEEKFDLIDGATDLLMNAGKRLYHKGSSKLIQRDSTNFNMKTFFNITTHRVSKNPNLLKVYPLIWDGQLYVVAAIANQPRSANKFKRLNVTGVSPGDTHEDMTMIMFSNVKSAIRYMDLLQSHAKVAGSNEAKTDLRNMPQQFFRL